MTTSKKPDPKLAPPPHTNGEAPPAMREATRYTTLLSALGDGAVKDLRMKFAENLLVAMAQGGRVLENTAVGEAMAAAALFYQFAENWGWITPLPVGVDIPAGERAAVLRNAEAQVSGQLHGQSIANRAMEQQGRGIVQVPPGTVVRQ